MQDLLAVDHSSPSLGGVSRGGGTGRGSPRMLSARSVCAREAWYWFVCRRARATRRRPPRQRPPPPGTRARGPRRAADKIVRVAPAVRSSARRWRGRRAAQGTTSPRARAARPPRAPAASRRRAPAPRDRDGERGGREPAEALPTRFRRIGRRARVPSRNSETSSATEPSPATISPLRRRLMRSRSERGGGHRRAHVSVPPRAGRRARPGPCQPHRRAHGLQRRALPGVRHRARRHGARGGDVRRPRLRAHVDLGEDDVFAADSPAAPGHGDGARSSEAWCPSSVRRG